MEKAAHRSFPPIALPPPPLLTSKADILFNADFLICSMVRVDEMSCPHQEAYSGKHHRGGERVATEGTDSRNRETRKTTKCTEAWKEQERAPFETNGRKLLLILCPFPDCHAICRVAG